LVHISVVAMRVIMATVFPALKSMNAQAKICATLMQSAPTPLARTPVIVAIHVLRVTGINAR